MTRALWAPWRLEYVEQADELPGCFICEAAAGGDDERHLVVHRTERAVVLLNRYPYASGHLLVAPLRHVGELAGLGDDEALEVHRLAVAGLAALAAVFAPHGFNLGWNLGRVAGAGLVDHVHEHVVPRWAGDTSFMPVLADVKVLPEHLAETRRKLAAAWPAWSPDRATLVRGNDWFGLQIDAFRAVVSPPTRALVLLGLALLALALPPGRSQAAGGRYVFDGGTAREHAQVRSALAASSFPWDVVPGVVTVHVARGVVSHAVPGEVWLDGDLLDAGRFSWAAVQEEFAHEVDFLLLGDADRAALARLFGTQVWGRADAPGLAHDAYGCERFAAALVWSYWPSPLNAYGPGAVPPQTFRSVVRRLLATA